MEYPLIHKLKKIIKHQYSSISEFLLSSQSIQHYSVIFRLYYGTHLPSFFFTRGITITKNSFFVIDVIIFLVEDIQMLLHSLTIIFILTFCTRYKSFINKEWSVKRQNYGFKTQTKKIKESSSKRRYTLPSLILTNSLCRLGTTGKF